MPTYQDSVDHLMATGKVTNAVIFDTIGKPLAVSNGYDISREEGAQIANGFDLVDGMKGFDFFLNGHTHFVDTVLSDSKLIGHKKDASIDREITNQANLAITNERSIFAHARHIILVVEFHESNNSDVHSLVDTFVKKPPRA